MDAQSHTPHGGHMDLAGRVQLHHTAWRVFRTAVLLLLLLAPVGGCTSGKILLYEGFGRDRWQQPQRVVSALGIQPGDQVADLGSGSGYFTVRLARAVGPGGKVFAVDVDEKMHKHLCRRLAKKGIQNVELVLARTDDPLLPDAGLDLVLNTITYHHIENRPTYFRNLQRDLAPGGRVAIVDFDGSKFMRLLGHYTPPEIILREMGEAGYEVVESFDFLDRQSFVIFRPITEQPAGSE